jgi:hypothetical protein
MHKKYASQGLVAISVSVDEPDNRDKALKFLQKQGATFRNYLLNEEAEVWQAKWKIKAPPAVFVFDRNNKRAGKFDTDDPDKSFKYTDVEEMVELLLRQ